MILADGLRFACLLVYANKIDLPHSLSAEEVTQELRLDQITDRKWHAAILRDHGRRAVRWTQMARQRCWQMQIKKNSLHKRFACLSLRLAHLVVIRVS